MLSKQDIIDQVVAHLPFALTDGQKVALEEMSSFICENSGDQLFVLRGYAGTGKTTLMSAIVKTMKEAQQTTVLLAPTGRAAKVFSSYSKSKAYTIHKVLYRVSQKEGMLRFSRRKNTMSHVLFIVDEVSMISDQGSGSSSSLLEDLMKFVYEGIDCKMIFVGDDAQLPPVHLDESPALDTAYLQRNFNVQVSSVQLTTVVRQAIKSGILFNATKLRDKIGIQQYQFPLFSNQPFADFQRVNGGDLEELLHTLYSRYDSEEVVIVTRSNKRAYQFNEEVRRRILFRDSEIACGDFIMAVKNNYYWVEESSEVGFIANGDIMEILSINKMEEIYGFHFAEIAVRLVDYPDFPHINVKVILESLKSEEASLNEGQITELYRQVAQDYQEIKDGRLRYLKIKNDPYLNAIQVKFSYSLTCHKTQGGQWKAVLIDQGYISDKHINKEYLRWIYTALTRASENVYLINFTDSCFEE
ncbi:MAG: AAA family ATPase [Bacteroidales bacterium]|jgi:exodeoxyribonuclease-5|nr:AAA family ATPase [Bacteroidales bacterium]